MKQKGLGRGLDAIFGTDTLDTKAKPMSSIAEIAVDLIFPNPTQPRHDFDEDALQELSDSIAQLGVIQPITVKEQSDGRYIIISGERRWRASKIAGLESIPAYIRQADDRNLHAMALVENIQREDLNAIEVALGLQRLVEECGLTQDALSEKLGKKRSTIANYMRLLKLPDEVQLAVKEGVISMGHAKAVAALQSRKEQIAALKKRVKNDMSVRQIEEYVRLLLEKPIKSAKTEEDYEYPEAYSRLVEQLEKLFNDNISIKRGKNGGGKIIIGFENDSDIEGFVARFGKH